MSGNEQADIRISDQFDALFLENWPRIYSLLLRLIGDPDEAEDLAGGFECHPRLEPTP
jgi:DNA-directed RNA polymerase specialized sigma24 family protein